jgi:uncharacterized protein with HEPN domain
MSKKRRDKDFLSDIAEAMEMITRYTKGLTLKKFMIDRKTQDAVVRNLEIIGEATKNISNDLKTKYPEIPWKKLAGLRDKLIHFYFGIDYKIVWNIVRKELPKFINPLTKVLKRETDLTIKGK